MGDNPDRSAILRVANFSNTTEKTIKKIIIKNNNK
jgi:hypothetical protein